MAIAISGATRKVHLTETLREATAALTLLDAEALERLSARLTSIATAVQTGATGVDGVVEHEPVEAILARQRVLASVLAATAENLKVLERMEGIGEPAIGGTDRSLVGAGCGAGSGNGKVRTEWVR